MPIRKIERQLEDQGVLGNLPRFGKLRKGGEKTEKSSGRDLDHFRLTLEPEYEDQIRPAFESLFGTEPTEFHGVLLAADSGAQAFDYWYEAWAHAKLLRRCDGEQTTVSWYEAQARYDTEPTVCTCNPLSRECKQTGRMDILIPALCEATGLWGKLTLLTTSLYDVIALAGYMKVADAFMLKLPNIAFWSVPFTVGRALRNVPVTINGKRSIKPMHLLYAQIEPEFNKQVLTPLLTQPAQLLLAGVSAETGELPEIEMEQAASWDRDWVNEQTLNLFDHENHQANAIDKLIADGAITDQMDSSDVIQVILEAREKRNAEKAAGNGSKSRQKGSKPSAAQEQVQPGIDAAFIGLIAGRLKMNMGDIQDALSWCSIAPLATVTDFEGTRDEAWAACVLHKVGYDAEGLAQEIPDETNVVRVTAEKMLDKFSMPF